MSLFVGSITFSGPARILSCPGNSVQYTCTDSSTVSSITWSVRCPDQQGASTTYSVQRDERNTHYCHSSSNGENVNFMMSLTFLSSSITESSLSITVLDADYSIGSFKSLRIGCEDSGVYKYLDITG